MTRSFRENNNYSWKFFSGMLGDFLFTFKQKYEKVVGPSKPVTMKQQC